MNKNNIARNIERNLLSTFFTFLIAVSMMKCCFAAMLNFKYFNVETSSESAGSYAAALYFIGLAVLFIFLGFMTTYYWQDINERVERSGNLAYEDNGRKGNFKGTYIFHQYRTTHIYYYLYPMYFIIRRVLVASILVYWHEYGFYQLLFLSLLSGVSLVWFVSYQPFRSRLRNMVHAIHEVGYLLL
jgi:hypothetical protein